MSDVPPTRRRWFQFGIGTMLLLVTVFALWLAWQVRIVRDRQAMMALLKQQGGSIMALKDWRDPSGYASPVPPVAAVRPPQISVPFWRRWIGDEPIVEVACPVGSDESYVERARAAFPEADVKKSFLVPPISTAPAK
jgi:hypothetical protein